MDPLGNLVDWIEIYGIFGLFAIELAERFLPALPSYGVLVAIGVSADGIWFLLTAVIATTLGSFMGALGLYFLVRAIGRKKSATLLYAVGRWVGLSHPHIDWTLSSLQAREGLLTILSQLIPTIRLISPIAAGLLGTNTPQFVSGMAVGIVLWNGLFIAAGYLAGLAFPGINSSLLALKILVVLVVAEIVTALVWQLQRRHSMRMHPGASKR